MKHDTAPQDAPRASQTAGGQTATWKPLAFAAQVGVASFLVGIVAEDAIIRATSGDRLELEWLSDLLISLAVAGIAYLWLHLRASRTRLLALEREQIVIGEQLRLAAEIQRSFLPELPQSTPGYRWAARMIPAGQVGGDFYDFVRTTDGTVLAMLSDVSGKGIPAALILSSLKTLFRSMVRETGDPAAIAARISAALHEELAGVPYATGIIVRFETAPGRLAYVNAGHPPGFVLRDGAITAELEPGGPPLGLLPGARYASAEVRLSPGDLGVLVTDGVTEALDAGPATLGRILSALRERSPAGSSPAEVCDHLLDAAAKGPGPAGAPDWQDDRSVFVFGVEPAA